MRKSIYLGVFVISILSARSYCQQGWFDLTSGQELKINPYDFYFLSVDTGFVIQRTTYRTKFTTDGGLHWRDSTIPISMKYVYPDLSYSKKYFFILLTDSVGRTIDSGKTWSYNQLHLQGSGDFIYFLTPASGFLMWGDEIWKSADSGKSFTKTGTNIFGVPNLLRFRDSLHGLCGTDVVGASGLYFDEYMWSTSDGGNTWDSLGWAKVNGQEIFIGSLQYYNRGSLQYLYGLKQWRGTVYNGTVFSSDDGLNWEFYPMPRLDRNLGNTFSYWDESIGYGLNTYGEIYKTTDGGHSWKQQQVPDDFGRGSYTSTSILAVSKMTAYASYDSIIIKTTTGGDTLLNSVINIKQKNRDLYLLSSPVITSADFQFSPLTSPQEFHVFDLLGRELLRHEVAAGEQSLHVDMHLYPPGIYFARLGNETVRFVKL